MTQTIIDNLIAALPGLVPVLYSLVVATALDALTGVWAAWNSGTLDSKFIPEFIQSHVVKKVAPILMTLVAGVAVGGTDSAAGLGLLALAGTSVTAYLAASIASIKGNLADGFAGNKGLPSAVEPPPTE